MTKVPPLAIFSMSLLNTKESTHLFETILQLQSIKEARHFFHDLLTEQEIQEFSNRWLVARLLSDSVPYTEIEAQTGMSSTTIARISKALHKGMNGYNTMINRTHHTDTTSSKRRSS